MKQKYFWQVEYYSGIIRKQFENNNEITWKEVDESQIRKVSWVKKTLFGSKIKATIELEPGEKVVICRRTHIGIGVSSMKEKNRRIEYLLGKNGEYTIKLE